MSQAELIRVPVAVALVTNENQEVLWVFNDTWGEFTLPMKKFLPPKNGVHNAPATALRAAAEVLGVPVRLVERWSTHHEYMAFSQRQLVTKQYAYDVFHVEPHPDFAAHLVTRQPHLWLSPYLAISGEYRPLSASSRKIVIDALKDFGIPTRLQKTSALVIHRQSPERGLQFLLRWNDHWGYALPAKRRDSGVEPRAGADRVAQEELGLVPGKDIILKAASVPEVETHGFSLTDGPPAYRAPTDYVHALFEGKILHDGQLRSTKPLAWVTAEEIQLSSTAASDHAQQSPPTRPGKISPTVSSVLEALGYIDEKLLPEEQEEIDRFLGDLEGGKGDEG